MSKEKLASLLAEKDRRLRENKLAYYQPYPKQQAFHNAGEECRERMFSAGNQLGKTLSGAMEMAMHLTGLYPEWWKGKRFSKPIRAWAAGVSSSGVRETVQKYIIGEDEKGTGAIPKELLSGVTMARGGITGAVDTVKVKHKSGRNSTLIFKTYEQGREKWQGDTLDLIWFDEEPPQDIYSEGLARIRGYGMVYMTFTPLNGMTEVAKRFFMEDSASRHLTIMEIDDVDHYSDEEKKERIDGYQDHEREARARGLPVLGSGKVYPVKESDIKIDHFRIPEHWPRIAGIDFGWSNNAVVWLAWDRDEDTVYIYDCIKSKQETVKGIAGKIIAKGGWIPVAWPHDGEQHDRGSGNTWADQYKHHGCNMLFSKAEFIGGGNKVEPGINIILEMMNAGRFKVLGSLEQWFEEFRLYHRKEGKIVKANDHIMDATRYAVMMLRSATTHAAATRWEGRNPNDYMPKRHRI